MKLIVISGPSGSGKTTLSNKLIKENKNRFVIFPIKHHDIWEWYKKMEASFWTAEEIDLHQDLNDWNTKLNDLKLFKKLRNNNFF